MIAVYSTNCPKCHVLIKKLEKEGIEFTLYENLNDLYEASEKYNIQEAPFVVFNDKVYNFTEAIRNLDSFR